MSSWGRRGAEGQESHLQLPQHGWEMSRETAQKLSFLAVWRLGQI